MHEISVTKRDGRTEPFNPAKVHKVVNWAIEDLTGVSLSDIEMAARTTFTDGVKTSDIQASLIKAASDLISEQSPDYQWVASRLLNWSLRDEVWGGQRSVPTLRQIVERNVAAGRYDPSMLDHDLETLDGYLNHNRDYHHTYAGMLWLAEKYLVQDRASKAIFETPQFAYMGIAMGMFQNEENRNEKIKEFYDFLSMHNISAPTPVLCGVRTPLRQFASCTLIDVGDSLKSIASSATALMYYASQRAGIGLNIGRIRPIGSRVGHGEIIHTGLIPYLKVLQESLKCTTQNGVRSASATAYFPFWHPEVETLLILKNATKNPQDRMVTKLDYCVQLSRLFYERLQTGGNITLFSPHEAVGLYDAFGMPEFDDLYRKYEADTTLQFRKQVPAVDIFNTIINERVETGKVYVMHMDHANSHSSFSVPVHMSNLCTEVVHPTTPLQHIDDPNGEIGICMLSAINVLTTERKNLARVCRIIVRYLDNLIDYQEYPVKAGENFCKKWRSLAIGITNLAAWLAKQGLSYDSPEAPNVVSDLMEEIQYHLLDASCDLAAERGPCEHYQKTKYAQGLLPLDHYWKGVDKVVTTAPKMPWEVLRAKIAIHGLRHSTLTAQMPCESSSVVQNSTNGIEPPRGVMSFKKSKTGMARVILPGIENGWKYDFIFDRPGNNRGQIRIVGAMQKWMDMSISTNIYYDYTKYPDNMLPLSEVIQDQMHAYSVGAKTIYYTIAKDGDKQSLSSESIRTDAEAAVAATTAQLRIEVGGASQNGIDTELHRNSGFELHNGYGGDDSVGCDSGACAL